MASKSPLLLAIALCVCTLSWQIQGQHHPIPVRPGETTVPIPFPLPHPIPLPVPDCPICDKLALGFGDNIDNRFAALVAQLTVAQQTVEVCTSSLSTELKIVTSKGNSQPGKYENAVCPVGYILIDCQCSRQDSGCYGVFISSNGRRCRSKKPEGNGNQQFWTIGTCVPDNGNIIIRRTSMFAMMPTRNCPASTEIIACVLEHRSSGKVVHTIITGNTCTVDSPCGTAENPTCRISAVCKKV